MTTPKSDDELLPCRCGERDQIFICDRSPYGFDRPRQNIYTMECRECGFAVVAFVDPWDEQKKPLAEEWNRRALLQQPKRVEAELIELRDELRRESAKTDCYTCYRDQAAYVARRIDKILATPQEQPKEEAEHSELLK